MCRWGHALRRGAVLAVAAVLVVLLISLAPATADDSRGHGKGHHHKRFSALIFSKTAAFRHTECIPQGTVAIAQMGTFDIDLRTDDVTVNNWGYRLAARDGGTDVTEFFRLDASLPTRLYWLVLGPLRGRTNRKGMRTTLERMKAVLES